MNYYYGCSIGEFLQDANESILGKLARATTFDLEVTSRDAWIGEIEILKQALTGLNQGHIFLEFRVPCLGRRIDTVLIIDHAAFVVEFKVGKDRFVGADLDQVFDYVLDLKSFHETSHATLLIPVLVATEAGRQRDSLSFGGHDDFAAVPIRASKCELRNVISEVLIQTSGETIDPLDWANGRYMPTPTILEAAKALYSQHSVAEISRSGADAINLTKTSSKIDEIIEHTKASNQKSICFVTGVPGAGKTLVGLNAATSYLDEVGEYHAVYLSGNGPLVRVMREALARDAYERKRLIDTGVRKQDEQRSVEAFVRNVHHFRDMCVYDQRAPNCHIAIFDEAQRAWNAAKTQQFMREKDKPWASGQSESRFLISCMDRHSDWAVIVCLVGEGQEIHDGEAGIEAWIEAISHEYSHWNVYLAGELVSQTKLERDNIQLNVEECSELHLSVSLRSFKAENLSQIVKSLLEFDEVQASKLVRAQLDYPIVITRDIEIARSWLHSRARGNQRTGLLASSGARRLKAIGVHVKNKIDPVSWFLEPKSDVRSSYFLEDVGTEFDVQGLELDWAGLIWDADLRMTDFGWDFKEFHGSDWRNVESLLGRKYLLNSYRVLLTRARRGMVIVVPEGDSTDRTRLPEFYDGTFDFLRRLGFQSLS